MILRGVVAALAVLFAAAALAGFVAEPASFPVLLVAGVVLLGTVFESWRYRARQTGPAGANWRPSGERFVDPESGRVLAVEIDPATGARRYTDDGAAAIDP